MLRHFIYILLGAGFMACSSVSEIQVGAEYIPVDNISYSAKIDSIIHPYRDSLEEEMNVVIGYAPKDFERNRPNGSLNNWAADVVGHSMLAKLEGRPFMCLLNVGGLRNSINKGPVTIGDIFKVMPFDNEVVAVELPIEVLTEIEEYLLNKDGEPIANALLKNREINIASMQENASSFWVVTSDYLMNGGDNMTFFSKRTKEVYLGKLMRDVMIDAVIEQDTLHWNNEQRIILE
ncbi:MAG: 5'-nucleotidase C-terminal domain-containing protein [Crocinitomicaceae bacterium]